MSGLLFPGEEDFFLARGNNGQILCTRIQGFALILFYSNNCPGCRKLLPMFNKLPELVGGCIFAKINVGQAREVIRLSKATIAPIEFVPYIIFYINGKPYMRYNGPAELKEIQNFVIEVTNNIQNKQTFAPEKIKGPERDIPEYSVGKPLCGTGEGCYIHYDEAYPEMPPGSNLPAEKKIQDQKGQYLGYEDAYHGKNERADPNREHREEYAQRQLAPHQRQKYPSQPQYNQRPPEPQYPSQPQYNQRQPQPPQYNQPKQPQQIRSAQNRPQYPQEYPPPQYPSQGRPQPQNIPHMRQQQYPPPTQNPRAFMEPHSRRNQTQYGLAGY